MMTTEAEVVLDERYGHEWDLYRLATGGWAFKVRSPEGVHTLTALRLSEVLGLAVEYVPMPVVPRAPSFERLAFTVRKQEPRRWLVESSHGHHFTTQTKREATAATERVEDRHRQMVEQWVDKWGGYVDNHTAGEDFTWSTRPFELS